MRVVNMGELNYDEVRDITITLQPCQLEMLIRGLETYMFIFHNIYNSKHEDTDEEWLRDFIAMNLYNILMQYNKTAFKTNYDVFENSEKHANQEKRQYYNKKKNLYKKSA